MNIFASNLGCTCSFNSEPEISVYTGVAVGAGGEMFALLADSSSLVLPVDVHGLPESVPYSCVKISVVDRASF
jgi:hypothetical protein